MNNVCLIGRLTRDPELRYTGSGKAVANFNMAVNRPFSNTDEADFFNCVAWNKTGETLANYKKKGDEIGIIGRIQSRTYENKDGNRVNVVEVVANEIEFLRSKGSGGSNSSQGNKDKDTKKVKETIEEGTVSDLDEFQAIDDDEDVPF